MPEPSMFISTLQCKKKANLVNHLEELVHYVHQVILAPKNGFLALALLVQLVSC